MSFSPNYTFSDLQATERYAAIREILHRLVHVGAIPSQAEEPLFAAFRQREQVMSTGVGFGIAIPHVTSRFVTEQVIALGQSESGVDFSSLDGHPVSEIVLMISPHSPDAHPNT